MIISCPNCNDLLVIDKIKCGIFRHATYKTTGKQVNPHANQERCEYLVKNNKIYGCCKPFRVVKINDDIKVYVCEYI